MYVVSHDFAPVWCSMTPARKWKGKMILVRVNRCSDSGVTYERDGQGSRHCQSIL